MPRFLKGALLSFLLVGFCYLVFLSITPELPSPEGQAVLYSNQSRQDLKNTLLTAISKAKKSIHMVSFGISDPAIIQALFEKSQEHVKIHVYYDRRSSLNFVKSIEGIEFFPIEEKGLMHQKILVIDEKLVLLGSANLTTTSLQMHDNLIIGFYSPKIAHFLIEKSPFTPGFINTWVSGQKVDLWILPDSKNQALRSLQKLLRESKKSIYIGMFTFTHSILLEELIQAAERGIDVKIVIDRYSAFGASAATIKTLKEKNIKVYLSTGMQLFHHKFIYIDETHLINGSTNWTKSAFYKNRDTFLVLHHLTRTQKNFMNNLWHTIEMESSFNFSNDI